MGGSDTTDYTKVVVLVTKRRYLLVNLWWSDSIELTDGQWFRRLFTRKILTKKLQLQLKVTMCIGGYTKSEVSTQELNAPMRIKTQYQCSFILRNVNFS